MTLPPFEDSLDDLHLELGQARREADMYWRAPFDGRAGEGWSEHRAREKDRRVLRLERELAEARARQQAEEDAWAEDSLAAVPSGQPERQETA